MRRTGKTKKRRGCTIRPISSVYAVAKRSGERHTQRVMILCAQLRLRTPCALAEQSTAQVKELSLCTSVSQALCQHTQCVPSRSEAENGTARVEGLPS